MGICEGDGGGLWVWLTVIDGDRGVDSVRVGGKDGGSCVEWARLLEIAA
mgnify:CR=1 FL=1